MAIMPTSNPASLWAYYLGWLALIPCLGLVLGPFALACGVRGVRAANARPEIEGKGHAIVGIVLGAFATLLHVGLILLVVGVSLAR